MNLYLIG